VTDLNEESENPGPEFEVWNHLYSAVDQAHYDMARMLSTESMHFWEALADHFLALRVGVLVESKAVATSEELSRIAPNVSDETWQRIVASLGPRPKEWNPWLRHAVELRIAEMGVHRAAGALERFARLRAAVITRPVPKNALDYMKEVVDAYLFGFDAACIALACCVFEQVAKLSLIAHGEATKRELEIRSTTAHGLRLRLRELGLLSESNELAKRLIGRRNTVMHRGLYDNSIMPQLSLDSVSDLIGVCLELEHLWPSS